MQKKEMVFWHALLFQQRAVHQHYYPSCGESTIFAMPKMYLTIEKWNQWYVNTNFDFPLFGNAKYNVNQKSQCYNKIKPKYLCIFLGLFGVQDLQHFFPQWLKFNQTRLFEGNDFEPLWHIIFVFTPIRSQACPIDYIPLRHYQYVTNVSDTYILTPRLHSY